MKKSKYFFILTMFCAIPVIFAQENSSNTNAIDQRQRYMSLLQKQSTPLYEMEQQIQELERDVQSIVLKYQHKELSREEAYEQIRPLLEKQLAIRQSKEFQLEHMIIGLLSQQPVFSLPKSVSTPK